MIKRKFHKFMMIGVMFASILTPYQSVFAANDDGNGDSSTGRYIDYKILDGVNELIEPSPVLPNGIDEKTFSIIVNHKAAELNGRDAKIRYRVTGAGGVEYKKELLQSGTVGSAFFPSTRNDNSYSFNLKFKRGSGTGASKEVYLPAHEAHYNLAVEIVFDAKDGKEQTFASLSKTIYVVGEKGYQKDDDTNYTNANGELKYDMYRLRPDGSLTGFSSATMTELKSDTLPGVYIEGFYKPKKTLPNGTVLKINYDVYAIESQSEMHLVKHFEQTKDTKDPNTYIQFNRKFHLSNEGSKGKASHSNFLDVAYLNDYPMRYVLRVSVQEQGASRPHVVLDKTINITDGSYTEPNYVFKTDQALPAVGSGKNLSFDMTNDTGTAIHDLDIAELRKTSGIKANVLGGILLPDIAVGKEVKVRYTLQTLEEDYVQSEDAIFTKYIQNNETKTYATGYNKEIYFRTGNPDPLDTRPVIYMKDYISNYILKVDLIYENNQVKDTIYWKVNIINDTVNHKIDSDAPFERASGLLDFEVNQVTKDAKGNISTRTTFTKAPVSALKDTPRNLEIRGTLRSPSVVGNGQEFKIGYDVSSLEDYSRNTIVKGYIQDVNVRGNEVEFNRLFNLSTEQGELVHGTKKDYVYVENYPSNYVVRVFLEDNTGRTHYFKDKAFELTNDTGAVVNDINYLLPQADKSVPTFQYPTRLDLSLQQYDQNGVLKPFTEASADTIKNTPLKLNIQSLLRNSDAIGANMEVRFDIVSYESYLNSNVNNVLKKYTQNDETRTYHVEANKDIYISTNTRTNRASDNQETTVYLEDETQNYQLRVEVLSNGQVYMKREIPFKINGIVDTSHKAPQDSVGPAADPNAPISVFLTDPNKNNATTKRLQITARQLNSEKAINIDLDGFVKKNWMNQDVLVRYDLVALNTYTDYINGNGVTTTLENDPEAQIDDQKHVLVSTMQEFLGKPSQNSFLKRYKSTNYTNGNYEPFTKRFTLRTKLDKTTYASNPSTLFLDNVARDYRLTVTATNITTKESISETIKLDITTVKKAENTAPVFSSANSKNISFRYPERGGGYFEGEFMPVSWYAATDADSTGTKKEYLYYKIYYYYSTQNEAGVINEEIQKYMLRYDDMPEGGNILSTEWQVPMSAKIEPAYLKGYACDVNHVCSEVTKSNPFKFNEFGVGEGNQGGSVTVTPATISLTPKPDGKWKDDDQEVYVVYEGDASMIVGATKQYAITPNSNVPTNFPGTVGADNKIVISTEGENYVHVRYILENGSEIYTSSGPYKIMKGEPDDFTMKLVDSAGTDVTDWTKTPPFLKMNYTGNAVTDGITYEYRIDNYHNNWVKLKPDTKIEVEGERTIYGRVVNKAGTPGPQKQITSRVDRSPVDFKRVILTESEDGKHEINIWAEDSLSGVAQLEVMDGGVKKVLENSSMNAIYHIEGLNNIPTSVKAIDAVGNENLITFANKPTVAFDAPYDKNAPAYRTSVKGKVTGTNNLSYKVGNKSFVCTSSPCGFTIDRNSLFTGTNTDGYKQSNKKIRISNIDKSDLVLLLDGQRDKTNAAKVSFNWNYNITSGTLKCYENGVEKSYSVGGSGVVMNNAINAVYECTLTGIYAGETVVSNAVVIYPDSTKPIEGGGSSGRKVSEELYVEESRSGTSYFINTKHGNVDKNFIVPVPEEPFN